MSLPLDEELQVVNDHWERENQISPEMSPLIGYQIPLVNPGQ